MPQSLFKVLVHIVFSTKNRADSIVPEIESELFKYFHGITENNGSKLIIANGTTNHVHLLISFGKKVDIPELVGDIKRDSSKWIKREKISANFIGKKVTAHFQLDNRKLKRPSNISKIKKRIIQNKTSKMSIERC